METNKIYQGNSLDVLKTFPDESINCVMTSPPYWALRDYGTEGQLGLEPTFQEYINKLCDIFDEVKRVLRKDGTCWVNMGDTYNNSGWAGDKPNKFDHDPKDKKDGLAGRGGQLGFKDKSLCCIPFRFVIEMQNHGWILRNVIIWHKPNCMPCSVKDRFTVDFEYLFFFVKNKKYFFETQYEPYSQATKEDKRFNPGTKDNHSYNWKSNSINETNLSIKVQNGGFKQGTEFGRNKRAVWVIKPKPFKESHFAVYPEELCYTPIKAGCPEFVCNKCGKAREKIVDVISNEKERQLISKNKYENKEQESDVRQGFNSSRKCPFPTLQNKGYTDCKCNAGFSGGIVLDPFFGAGTTGLVALKQNKKFIGIELNPEYIKIAEKRLKPFLEQRKLL